MANPDAYYKRGEVSNSDLSALKQLIHPGLAMDPIARERAFRFGTLVDAIITEPDRVDYYALTVDDTPYSEEDFRHAQEMFKALRCESRRDPLLAKVLQTAETQRCMINHGQQFEYGEFPFRLDTRCKWDWWMPQFKFGGDLKTTSACTQHQFDDAMDAFDWDRSRAWYMDIAGSDRDFIYAISKRNGCIFKKFIRRGDETYQRGRDKYEELAFQYWCFNLT